jgi:hypothetical protein
LSSDHLDSGGLLEPGRRVAITAFSVELVDLQFQPRLKRQFIVKPFPVYFGGPWLGAVVGIPLELSGIGRRATPMLETEQQILTSQLYDAFEADLRSRGLIVVPREVVMGSSGNQLRPSQPVRKSSLVMLLNPLGSDTGAVLHSRAMSEPGLGHGAGRWSRGPEEADIHVLKETNADIALDVRLRVGTYRTRAALEHRSVIRATSFDDMTIYKARASILSDADVTTETHFVPVKGRVVPVDFGLFATELTAMLPKFVSLLLAPTPE